MTTEEKLQHFYEVSMDTAREEATKVLDEYKAALETEMERHKQEKQAASESQFKIDSDNAAREINKALSAEHLHIKRCIHCCHLWVPCCQWGCFGYNQNG